MDEHDRLGWIKLFSLFSIVGALGSLLYAGYYAFAVFELSELLGLTWTLSVIASGLVAVIMDLKYDLQDCAAALLGIVISVPPLILFVWAIFF